MSFFVKAAVHALKKFPIVNASIDGNDIVYHGYFDIGVAVGSPRGLVVPVIRNADQLSFHQIEQTIADFGKRAQAGKIGIEELSGGTFSISNGGVFGSMLSTPIINPPQSAILGVHATKERPVVENGQVVIRPINYLALSVIQQLKKFKNNGRYFICDNNSSFNFNDFSFNEYNFSTSVPYMDTRRLVSIKDYVAANFSLWEAVKNTINFSHQVSGTFNPSSLNLSLL